MDPRVDLMCSPNDEDSLDNERINFKSQKLDSGYDEQTFIEDKELLLSDPLSDAEEICGTRADISGGLESIGSWVSKDQFPPVAPRSECPDTRTRACDTFLQSCDDSTVSTRLAIFTSKPY
jgi:hypothetical protein